MRCKLHEVARSYVECNSHNALHNTMLKVPFASSTSCYTHLLSCISEPAAYFSPGFRDDNRNMPQFELQSSTPSAWKKAIEASRSEIVPWLYRSQPTKTMLRMIIISKPDAAGYELCHQTSTCRCCMKLTHGPMEMVKESKSQYNVNTNAHVKGLSLEPRDLSSVRKNFSVPHNQD